VRDEPVKDAVQDVAEDVTQDVAGGVSGAAEDGSVKVFIVCSTAPHAFPRRHVKDEHAKGAAQLRRALRRACHRTWRRNWPSGPGRRAPSSPRHDRRRRLCAARAEMGRNWAAQWHLARAVGKRFRGCRAKRLYVYYRGRSRKLP